MTKYKVGDKVRILDVMGISWALVEGYVNGDVTKLIKTPGGNLGITGISGGYPIAILGDEFYCIEKISDKPTKKQRLTDAEQSIATLEQQVAELQAEVATLKHVKKKPKQRLADLHSKLPTPNEQRKAIIAEAKVFVEDALDSVKDKAGDYKLPNGNYVQFDFQVNAKKRTVVVVAKAWHSGKFRGRWIAKCAPDDVFNADIQKAIALGKALGLDVSKFENAVKPTEVVVGMVVKAKKDSPFDDTPFKVDSIVRDLVKDAPGSGWINYTVAVILDDTDAQY